MQMTERELHRSNALFSINESADPDPNVTLQREKHSRKQRCGMLGTEQGMQIDRSDEHSANAETSIQQSRESASKATIKRESQLKKHFLHSFSTEDGMQRVF
jgi:hypothetical protein